MSFITTKQIDDQLTLKELFLKEKKSSNFNTLIKHDMKIFNLYTFVCYVYNFLLFSLFLCKLEFLIHFIDCITSVFKDFIINSFKVFELELSNFVTF